MKDKKGISPNSRIFNADSAFRDGLINLEEKDSSIAKFNIDNAFKAGLINLKERDAAVVKFNLIKWD